KPLCLNINDLNKIKKTYLDNLKNNRECATILMIGFNRRFAPLSVKLKNIIDKFSTPKAFIYTINAGSIPPDNWIHNPEIGGGRLIGEACHFVDMLRFLAGSRIKTLNISKTKSNLDVSDTFCINLEFESGDIGNINYFSNGANSFPKERIEVFSNNSVIVLDNFKKIKFWGISSRFNKSNFIQNKGNFECVRAFIDAVNKGKKSPIDFEEIIEVHELLLGIKN
ncbi:Gfo/Idh/MocA family oxidoreductase, partial [Prochlorococcus sp. AH-716-E17]|nr:Gfo/Idh/MocA family oxidoreductase [Prochlorococcus sp. AH-716-E17]